MKSNKVKLIVLFSILAIAVSALAVGNLMARPSDSPSGAVEGTLTITGGFERTDKARFYSDKTSDCAGGCNVIAVSVVDADLSTTRTGTVVYQNIQTIGGTDGVFQILSGDGISTGAGVAGVNGPVAGVLQGETSATRNFTGDNSSLVFPLTNTVATITNVPAAGISVLTIEALGALDRDGSGTMTAADVTVDTGGGLQNVDAIRAMASSTTTTTADSVSELSLTSIRTDEIEVATGDVNAALSRRLRQTETVTLYLPPTTSFQPH